MNNRLNKPLMIVIGIIVLAALALFAYTVYMSRSTKTSDEMAAATNTSQTLSPSSVIVTAKHQYNEGRHIIVGQLSVPTPCHTLTAEPFFVGGASSTNVTIRFTTKQPDPQTVCAQVEAEKPFNVTFQAPKNITISAEINGTIARFNLIEVPAGEKIEGVTDEFFKG